MNHQDELREEAAAEHEKVKAAYRKLFWIAGTIYVAAAVVLAVLGWRMGMIYFYELVARGG